MRIVLSMIKSVLLRIWWGAFVLTILLPPTIAADGLQPATIDDILKIEGLGAAEFSPNGLWLVYNQIPPYDQLQDYSYWLTAARMSGHQVWIYNLERDQKPRLQPGLDRSATNFLFGFSPDSKYVVTIEHKFGRYRLVACRLGQKRCVRFDQMPDMKDQYIKPARWNERLVWTSPRTFIMPTRDDFLPGSEMRSRASAGRYLWREWNEAWTGRGVTASEVISTAGDRNADWASGELREFDIATGKTRVIASGRYFGARVSHDTEFVAAARAGERIRPSSLATLEPDETHPTFDRRYALRVVHNKTGEVKEFTTPFNIDPHSLTWSLKGHRFAVYGWDSGASPDSGSFYIINLDESGQPTEIDHDGYKLANSRLSESFPLIVGPARAILLSDGIALFARRFDTTRYDWVLFPLAGEPRILSQGLSAPSGYPLYADEEAIVVLCEDGVFRLHSEGKQERLSPAGAGRLRELKYTPKSAHGWSLELRMNIPDQRPDFKRNAIFVSTSDTIDGDHSVHFVDFEDSSWRSVDLDVEGAAVLSASDAASSAIFTVKDHGATRLLLKNMDGQTETLVTVNAHLRNITHPGKQSITYALEDPEGIFPPRQMNGCILLPPGYTPTRKYPLVIESYPSGTPKSCDTLEDNAGLRGFSSPDLWTSRGFVYMFPAIPLDLARTSNGPIAGMDEIVEQTVDAIVDQGFADPQKIILFGFSQGGLSSLYLATQSDVFAGVISMNGWADYFSHYFGARGLMRYFHLDQNGGDNRWRYECTEEGASNYCPFGFGTSPLENPDEYARSSPVALARGVSAPVFLVHSDLDYFDMSQYDEMFGALYRAGKEARYVRYWGEGHGPSSPANIRDLWRRIDRFLQENDLLGRDTGAGTKIE